ncbi:hypothetical protein PCASD_13915 [Puccinia coronata f. sp. avenae]|uniref:Uncharacterized protein n=1 Tax=Puccinia coronata f. sp. avenae TaxID=200324 RepID=A0A2N5UHA3_9BASI|nr:hypothetical protein PCASD_13915 [Puccinia coronata f. sp. avenae]
MKSSVPLQDILNTEYHTAGINRSNTAVQAVLKQPCSTGGRTGTVRPKHLPAGRTGLSDQFLGPVAQDQPGPVGQICPTMSVRPPVEHGCSSTARAAVFDRLMPAVVVNLEDSSQLQEILVSNP